MSKEYEVLIVQRGTVRAKNKKVARELVQSDPPHRDISGCGNGKGCYDFKTGDIQNIVFLSEKEIE